MRNKISMSNQTKCPYMNCNIFGGSYQNSNIDKSDEELLRELMILMSYDVNCKVRYIPSRPEIDLNLFTPEQYSPGEVYMWDCNIIPNNLNQIESSYSQHLHRYDKFGSVPNILLFYMGMNVFDMKPNDPKLSIFITNLRDRGPDNYRKKIYMSAVTPDKMIYYKDKIDKFLNEFYAQITTYSRPVLRAFRKSFIKFFLAIHIGYDKYPDYVIEYFENFIDIIGYADPRIPKITRNLIWGHKIVHKVREYFSQRYEIIKQTQDKTNIIYHWDEAGFDTEGLLMEAIHNIVAFSQFNNVLFQIIYNKHIGGYDFIELFNLSNTDSDRLNLVRELYRLLTPNDASFSRVIEPGSNNIIHSRHIHRMIMASIEGKNYSNYDPDRYNSQFRTDFSESSCEFPTSLIDNYNPQDIFTISESDHETVIPKNNSKFIPVFYPPGHQNNPRQLFYMPFGLGYRRCAGEILSYFITIKLLDKIKDLSFEFKQPPSNYETVTLAPFTYVNDNIFVINEKVQTYI